ncbi:MAG: hypothetical protein JHD35_13975 [Sphingopyxis sp.]|nr:hypothetical protein [Sphingopyxis sp.]
MRILLAFLFMLLGAGVAAAQTGPAAPLAPGKGDFAFTGWAGPPLRIFYQLPDAVTEKTPILFVFHGVQRDAANYRDEWARYARDRGFIVIAPEYGAADFPGAEEYSSGGFLAPDGSVRPRAQWSFAAIEPLFDEVKARTGTRVPRYILYGHSGGAQFVQRYMLMMPEARVLRAIAANAGWYTMPDLDTEFPYGLKGSPVDRAGLAAALGRPLWILLGARDTNPNSAALRQTAEALRQGRHRLARGDSFYRKAVDAAASLGLKLAWQRRYVPDAGHDNAAMSRAAVDLVVPRAQ